MATNPCAEGEITFTIRYDTVEFPCRHSRTVDEQQGNSGIAGTVDTIVAEAVAQVYEVI